VIVHREPSWKTTFARIVTISVENAMDHYKVSVLHATGPSSNTMTTVCLTVQMDSINYLVVYVVSAIQDAKHAMILTSTHVSHA